MQISNLGDRSIFFKHSLIGHDREIIHPDVWDLPAFDNDSGMITHEHTVTAFDFMLKNHKKKGDLLLLTNCASRKPYTTAKTISAIHKMVVNVKESIDIAVVSSLGIIPIEYERHYPFAHYAWDHDDSEEARKVYFIHVVNRVTRFIEKFKYKWVVSIFRVNSKGKLSVQQACTKVPDVKLYEVPSWRTFDKIKDNIVKMNAFQTTNNEAKAEVKEIVTKLLSGQDPGERISPTKEERGLLIKQRTAKLKSIGKKVTNVRDFLK